MGVVLPQSGHGFKNFAHARLYQNPPSRNPGSTTGWYSCSTSQTNYTGYHTIYIHDVVVQIDTEAEFINNIECTCEWNVEY
jgi:hypothetical protein